MWSIFAVSDLFVIARSAIEYNDLFMALMYIGFTAISIWLAFESYKERKEWDAAHADQAK